MPKAIFFLFDGLSDPRNYLPSRRRNALKSEGLPRSGNSRAQRGHEKAASLGNAIGAYRNAAEVSSIPRGLRIFTIVEAIVSEQDWSVPTPTTDQASRSVAAKVTRSQCLTARGLTKDYVMGEVTVHALTEVDLDIYAGELVVLLGPSGSGKSTLLNILGGLDTPTRGSAFWNDHDLAHASEADLTRFRREHVGFVFQFYNLIPSLTVRENVALVTEIATDPMKPEDALTWVGLSERLDHFPAQLSGGEQQRVAIARAIVKRPQLLLCDEPTGALDHQTGRLVLEAIVRINRELATTTVLITHNVVIGRMADRILYLEDGRIARTETNTAKASPSELGW